MVDTADPRIYTIGWICAVEIEFLAAQIILEEDYSDRDTPDVGERDENNYAFGRIGRHNVVVAVLPHKEYGTNSAATVAKDMVHSFPNVRVGLMVGIAGGVPYGENRDIRLGDVVVSSPDGSGKGGLVQLDFGRDNQNQPFQITGHLNQPPQLLLTAVAGLKAKYRRFGHRLDDKVKQALAGEIAETQEEFGPQPGADDRLYQSSFTHDNCRGGLCGDSGLQVQRSERPATRGSKYLIHYGLIGSSNSLKKNAEDRDRLAQEYGILCVEMEAAGLANHFPCLAVRGICDYSDTHKNDRWQGFAAMMAAAYARDIIGSISPRRVDAQQRLADALKSVQQDIGDVKQQVWEAKALINDVGCEQRRHAVKTWLHPPDSRANINKARRLRHPLTGRWLLESNEFQQWTLGTPGHKHVWLHGQPGCGKTVLATTVLDHMVTLTGWAVISFYFDFNDSAKQTVDGLCRALVFQLSEAHPASAEELQNLYSSHGKGTAQPDEDTLMRCLENMLKVAGRTCILIDALDECSERKRLLEWLAWLCDLLSEEAGEVSAVQLVMTSRPEGEFEQKIPLLVGSNNCISLSQTNKTAVAADIASYIATRLHDPQSGFSRWADFPEATKQISDTICSRADGMFRWAACQMDSLEGCFDHQELQNSLQSLPRDLNETYDRIIQGIPPSRLPKALRLLQLLTFLDRPPTLEQVVNLMAVRVDGQTYTFRYSDRMPRPDEVVQYCPGLVCIVQEARNRALSQAGYRPHVQLAHFSVKEYILSRRPEFNRLPARVSLTRIFVAYFTAAANPSLSAEDANIRLTVDLFVRVLGSLKAANATIAEETVAGFLETSPAKYLHRYYSGPSLHQLSPGPMLTEDCAGVEIACHHRLWGVARHLIRPGGGWKYPSSYKEALQMATKEGHMPTIGLLLQAGAKLTLRSGPLSKRRRLSPIPEED